MPCCSQTLLALFFVLPFAIEQCHRCSLTSSVECYDPRTDAWTRLPDLPIPLARSSAVVFDSHVLLIGGETVSEDAKSPVATEKVYRYDLTTHTCKLFLVLPEPRHSAASIVLDNYLYILGGVLHSEATRSVLRINLSKCAEAFAKPSTPSTPSRHFVPPLPLHTAPSESKEGSAVMASTSGSSKDTQQPGSSSSGRGPSTPSPTSLEEKRSESSIPKLEPLEVTAEVKRASRLWEAGLMQTPRVLPGVAAVRLVDAAVFDSSGF